MSEPNYERRYRWSLVVALLIGISGWVAAGEWLGATVTLGMLGFAVLCVFGAAAGLESASAPRRGGENELS